MKKVSTLSKICSKNSKKNLDKWQSFSKDFNNVRVLFIHKVPRLTIFQLEAHLIKKRFDSNKISFT